MSPVFIITQHSDLPGPPLAAHSWEQAHSEHVSQTQSLELLLMLRCLKHGQFGSGGPSRVTSRLRAMLMESVSKFGLALAVPPCSAVELVPVQQPTSWCLLHTLETSKLRLSFF